MIIKLLTMINRNNNIENHADFGEKVGNMGLGLLRLGFGKTLTVEKISSGTDRMVFTKNVHSTSARVAAVVLFIFALPITILLAGIGYVGMAFSKSHGQILNSYNQSKQISIVGKSPETDLELASVQDFQPVTHQSVVLVNPLNTLKYKAATTIQKHVRGYLARKPHLPSYLYSQYYAQCKKVKEPGSDLIPQAQGGKTKVYLPQEIPETVLKNSGRQEAITRFHQMQKVRSILDSQNSSHLVIPKANLCQDFLVEQRLPINIDSYHNMGLYLSQPELFDEAVRELTRLFSKIYLSDLVDYQHHPLGHIAGVEDFVRYDNLPLYLVEKKGKKEGKIGLIDLEHVQNSPNSQALETLVRIFPLHLDVIKNEASRLKMNINERSLNVFAEKGRKYLQVGFIDHLKWLKQKDISTHISTQPFQVSLQRVEELMTLVEKELLKLNKGEMNDLFVKKQYSHEFQKNFFIENPEEIAKELAASILPLMIANIKSQIEKHQNKQLSKLGGQNMTESQLLSFRSLIIKRPKLHKGVERLIMKNQKIKFKDNWSREGLHIATQLTEAILEELVKGGEIFYFDPAYYTGGHDICWIRY